MIELVKEGSYELIDTDFKNKILILDGQSYAWIVAEGIGEILVLSEKEHEADATMATGKYQLYDIKNEPEFVDLPHLQLEVGSDKWQAYLLPNGLPGKKEKRHRIIPTEEIIKEK